MENAHCFRLNFSHAHHWLHFSRSYHRLVVFPRLPLVTFFLALAIGLTIFPLLPSVGCFPSLAIAVDCFPELAICFPPLLVKKVTWLQGLLANKLF